MAYYYQDSKIPDHLRRILNVVDLPQSRNLYSSFGRGETSKESDNYLETSQDLLERMQIDTERATEIVEGPKGFSSTQRALERVRQGAPIGIYDIENLGSPSIGTLSGKEKDFFDITQISFGMADSAEALSRGEFEVENIVFRQSADVRNILTQHLDALESDYSHYYRLSDRERGTLADLATFSNRDHFGEEVTLGGIRFKTLPNQENALSDSLISLTDRDNIKRMRQGLDNITNPELTTDPARVEDLIQTVARENPVLVGHNIERHDMPGLTQYLKAQGASQESIDFVNQDPLDTYRLAQNVLNKDGHKTKNYQLGTLYEEITPMPFGRGQAHNARYDVQMTGAVLDSLLDMTDDNLSLERQTVQPEDRFQVKRGFNFKEDSFNLNAGQHDMVTYINPDTGKHELQYGFRRGTGRGRTLEYRGEIEPLEIDDILHYGVSFYNSEEDTHHHFLRANRSEIDDLFNEHLVAEGALPDDEMQYIKQDRVRRHYNDIFTRPARYEEDTVTKRLQNAYEVADTYKEEVKALDISDLYTDSGDPHQEALERTIERVNKTRTGRGQYALGRTRIENEARLAGTLDADRDIFNRIGRAAQSHAGINEDMMTRTQRENLFYKDAFNTLSKQKEPMEYGHQNMEQMKIPQISNPGEFTYFNVESPGQMQAVVRNQLGQDMDRAGRGKTSVHFNTLMDTVGHVIDDEERNRLQKMANDDLKKGNISQGTVDQIAHSIYRKRELLKSDGVITNGVPGFDIERPFAHTVFQNGGELTNKGNSEFIRKIIDNAADNVDRSIARGSNKPFREIKSKELVQRFKTSDQRLQELREGVTGVNEALGVKSGRQNIFSTFSAKEETEKVLANFRSEGFQVKLEQVDGSDRVLLFATPDSKLNISEMGIQDLETHDRVFQAPLPLFNENMALDTVAGEMKDIQHINIDKDVDLQSFTGGDVTVRSSSEGIFDQLRYAPRKIKERMKDGESMEDAIGISRSAVYNTSKNLGVPSGYRSETADKMGYTSSSRESNRFLMIDTSSYQEAFAKEYYREVYNRFIEGKESGRSDNILDYMNAPGQSSRFRMEATNAWTEGPGASSGIILRPEGLNPNQAARGLMSLIPPSLSVPFAQLHRPIREQVNKPNNYRTVDREPLERYFREAYGEDSLEAMIASNPAQTSFNNMMDREEHVRSYEVPTLQASDSVIAEASEGARSRIERMLEEVDQSEASGDLTKGQANRRREELGRMRDTLDAGIISTYEDQYAVSEDLLGALSSSEHLELSLDGYELDDRLREFVQENLDIEEMPKGKSIELREALDYSDMQSLGIVSEDGKLTVGQLSQDVIMSGAGAEYSEAKRRNIQRGAELNGIEFDLDGNATLLINNRYLGDTGNKTLRSAGGTRESGVGVQQELIDILSEEITGQEGLSVQAITAFEKVAPGGRGGTGGTYTDLINTSSYNVRKAIDRLHEGAEQTGLQDVDDYFQNNYTVGDRFKDYQNYMRDRFIPSVNDTLGGEHISFVDTPGEQPFEFSAMTVAGDPEGRHRSLKNLTALAQDRYGMVIEDDYMVSSTGFLQHAVENWQGVGSRARYGNVELGLLNQTLQGPSPEQIQMIQDAGIVDGVDLREYQGFTRRPEDSVIRRNLDTLTKTTGSREAFEEYTRDLHSAREFMKEDMGLEDIQGDGNIIVDIAGDYDFGDDVNFLTFGEGDEAYTVVDGSRIGVNPKGRLPTGAEMQNTYDNLYSVRLFDGEYETTIGDMVEEQNSSAYVRMIDPDHPLAEAAQLENEVVQVVPMLKDKRDKLGDVYRERSEVAQAEAFAASYELIHGRPGDGVDLEKWQTKRVRRIHDGLSDFYKASGSYLGSKSSRNLTEIMEDNSFAAKLQGRNILSTQYDATDVLVSERQARELIKGRAGSILDANQVGGDALVEYAQDRNIDLTDIAPSDYDALQEDYIIDRITGVRGDDGLDVYTLMNRQPSQNEGNLLFGSLRVDNTRSSTDNHISVDPRVAALMGGDFDGDTGYLNTYPYLENMTKDEAVQLHREMRDMATLTRNMGLAVNHESAISDIKEEGQNSLLQLLGLTDPSEVETLFSDNLTEANAMVQILSDEMMTRSVGTIYNSVVGTRDALNVFSDSMLESAGEDNLILNDMRRLTRDSTQLMSQIQESAISRKKMEPRQIERFMKMEEGTMSPSGMRKMSEEGTLLDVLQAFDTKRAELPNMIQGITASTSDNIFEDLEALGILSYSEDQMDQRAYDRQTLRNMGHLQDAMRASPLDGYRNRFFRLGRSNATDDKMNFAESIINTPEQVPRTRATEELASTLFANEPEVIERWSDAQETVMDDIGETFSRLREEQPDNPIQDRRFENIVGQLNNHRRSDNARRTIDSQSPLYRQAKDGARRLGSSRVFQAAAGITAAWTVARAMSSGPTPEGNEAEQEMATAEEVAPSQLLTSPTARVKPQAEGVNLTVQASGNLSEQEVAGLINQEIASMTGQPMEMNINVTDNTAKLDQKFYQRAVDNAFGF